MKKYDSYKDSGIEWIGEIPSHWGNTRIKFTVNEKDSLFIDGDWIESKVITEDGIRYITTGNVKVGYYSEQGNGYISSQTFTDLNCTEVYEGDLIISRLNNPIGRACIVPNLNSRIVTSVDNVIYRPDSNLNKRYLLYLFSSKEYFEHTDLISRGATMQRISRGMLGNLKILLPHIAEQTAIANYLDQKTTQIDDLIAKKERLIQLLEEERIAIINQAVTKGLDPSVPMKDSGIEWLGEIPVHWEVKKLKYLLKETKDSLKTGPFGSHIKNSDYIPNGEYKVYTQRNVLDNEYEIGCESISVEKFNELKGFTIFEGDVLITTRGTIGRCSVFPNDMSVGILHPCLIRIQVNENLCLRNWVVNYINNTSLFYNNVKFNSNSTIIDVIYGYTLKEIIFPTPPIEEQHKILDFLSRKITEIDLIISKSQQEIELLKEYKTALISEVVTGKVDVRTKNLN